VAIVHKQNCDVRLTTSSGLAEEVRNYSKRPMYHKSGQKVRHQLYDMLPQIVTVAAKIAYDALIT